MLALISRSPVAMLGRHRDLLFAGFIIGLIAVLVLPMPSWLLDAGLAFSIMLSALILLIALMTERPLDFSSFPTVLLVATMIRLTLNLSSTRLILSHGHQGPQAAGHVIQAFGSLLMSGNFVIGIVVFVILATISLVVVNKGSGRIAEVGARFSLDAMPGKQMAIDADLSAGLIDEGAARRRRRELEEEGAFYGAMDGASKFVKGDAVAGLLIIAINILGGLVIGVAQHGLSLATAAQTYTLLTVGDGLVAAIPSILVSVGAGILVSKAGVVGPAGRALTTQLGQSPKALGLAAALLMGLGLVPGMPLLPFLGLAGTLAALAWRLPRWAAAAAPAAPPPVAAAPPIGQELRFDPLRIELGSAAAAIAIGGADHLGQRVQELRRQLARRYGFVLPIVEVRPNPQLPPGGYVVFLRNVEAARGEVAPARLLVMNPAGPSFAVPGEDTREPAFGLPARWIEPERREAAEALGYAVVDPTTVITVHLTELVRDNMAELLDYGATQRLLSELPGEHQKLVADLTPALLPLSTVQRVLQALLAEQVSIRDLALILDAMAEAAAWSRDPALLTERARARLARQLCQALADEEGFVEVVTLAAEWQHAITAAVTGTGEQRQLALPPGEVHRLVAAIRAALHNLAAGGRQPALLVANEIRPLVRALLVRFQPRLAILAHEEVHPRARLRTLAEIPYEPARAA